MTTVVHCKREPYDVYVGRGRDPKSGTLSIWGNPFSHKDDTLAKFKVASVEEAIAKYREWIQTQPHLMSRIHTLKDKVLGCWCVPYHACHGEVLAELADKTQETGSMKLAIIGTAGRGTDGNRLHTGMYGRMHDKAITIIGDLKSKGLHVTELVSGGAAWADHLAVQLFLENAVEKLSLYLPCQFDLDRNRFEDSGIMDWQTNPGGTLNYYHRRFSNHLDTPSLNELSWAICKKNCQTIVNNGGLKARNTDVAREAEGVVAFTFGDGPMLKDGGTADTMRKFLEFHPTAPAYHVDLNSMLAWRRAILPEAA